MEVVQFQNIKNISLALYFLNFPNSLKLRRFKLDLRIRISRRFVWFMSRFMSQLLVSGYFFECFQNGDNKETNIWQNFVFFSLLNDFQRPEWHF
jgi:hypothetical protein